MCLSSVKLLWRTLVVSNYSFSQVLLSSEYELSSYTLLVEVLPLINHMTFKGELNDLAGADQVEMADAGELNCF